MKGEFSPVIHYGMARVASSLKPDDDIVVFREKIDHPALSFITPVDAYYCAVSH